MKHPKLVALLIIGDIVVVLLLLFWWMARPGYVDAAAWNPPQAPALEGPTAPNTALLEARLIARGKVWGPEDVAVDSQGRVYAGTQDGLIVRVDANGQV
ncbi:MAG: hypothetical protein OEM03_06135, partial [Chromatiales bacterium]|nr:hypothetical protein [Chromatiales bacterium]